MEGMKTFRKWLIIEGEARKLGGGKVSTEPFISRVTIYSEKELIRGLIHFQPEVSPPSANWERGKHQ